MKRFDALLTLALAVWETEGLKSPALERLKAQFKPEQGNYWQPLLLALHNKEDFTVLDRRMSGARVRNTFRRYYDAAREMEEGNWPKNLLSM